MTKETWSQFKSDTYLKRLFPEKNSLMYFTAEMEKHQWKLMRFVQNILKQKVSLDEIVISGWNKLPFPYVYIGKGRTKKYRRFAKNDYKLALKYLKKINHD